MQRFSPQGHWYALSLSDVLIDSLLTKYAQPEEEARWTKLVK